MALIALQVLWCLVLATAIAVRTWAVRTTYKDMEVGYRLDRDVVTISVARSAFRTELFGLAICVVMATMLSLSLTIWREEVHLPQAVARNTAGMLIACLLLIDSVMNRWDRLEEDRVIRRAEADAALRPPTE